MSDLPRFTFDREANAGYVRLRAGRVARTASVGDFMAVDYGTDGGVIGVELLTLDPTPEFVEDCAAARLVRIVNMFRRSDGLRLPGDDS